MKSPDSGRNIPVIRKIILSLIIFLLSGTTVFALSDGRTYKLKDSYKIKRTADGTVCLFSKDNPTEAETFVFTDFNADVLLLVYRRIDLESMISSLSKKYYLSRTDARRSVKMALNELESWSLITRH
ncbi:MAG: hypothetical protein JW801_10235 [Bacteroidales bacterium]|nr:hypothetical protein [Bacteroidales bacterium]